MTEKKSLKWLLNVMQKFEAENSTNWSSMSNYSFTTEDELGLSIVVDGKKHVKEIQEADYPSITITPTIDYLFVSFPASQPLNFLRESPAGVEPILLNFNFKDRNTFLSTKMVREYFSNCTQFFLCSVNGNKSKGSQFFFIL